MNTKIILTQEEVDRLLLILGSSPDPDALHLAKRIYGQQIYNPSDQPLFAVESPIPLK
jgi:hypothetical protein